YGMSAGCANMCLVPLTGITSDELGTVRLGVGGSPYEGKQTADENVGMVLSAEPTTDYTFLKWMISWDANASDMVKKQLQDLNSTASTVNPLTLDAHADLQVTAVFVPKGSFYTVQLSVEPSPDGEVGSVRILPDDGIYLADSDVTIEAFPIEKYIFGGWKGDLNSTANPLVLSLDRSLSLVASFYREGSVLSINGSVSPIDIGSSPTVDPVQPGVIEGTGLFAQNEVRTLRAKAHPGYLFSNWDGEVPWIGSDENVTITVSQGYVFTATFIKDTNDSDGDGLDNHTEIVFLKTNPLLGDTDGDGMNDKYENLNGLDPLRSDSVLINLIKAQPSAFNMRLYDSNEVSQARSQGVIDGNAESVKLWADFNSTMAQNGFSFHHINERNDLYRFIAGPSAPGQTGLGWFYTEQHGWAWLRPSSPGWIYMHNGRDITNLDGTTVSLNWLNLNPAQSDFDQTIVVEPSYPFSQEQFFWLQGQSQGAHYPRNAAITGSPSSGNGNNSNVGGTSQGNSGAGSETDSNDGFGDLFGN
ncbi:MAG: hypothetical protein OSB19_18820, partial [Opitutaceae bacterium]|nr:hypothetical protein [Opitutaceae bacterium]